MSHNAKLNAARLRSKDHSMMADVFDGTDTPKAEASAADVAQDKKEAKNGK